MEDLGGKQLGQYQVISPLGEGGMAAVYKAYQSNMDRYVALKILPRHLASDPEFVSRFKQEAKLIAQLQHPHILPVYDFGEYDEYTYIVMPFVKTGTLADLLQGQPVSLELTIKLVSQIGDALDYAHARGVIHRDVKPSNILMDESGNCLLTDFGIAKMIEDTSHLTQTGRLMGTPAYMSPEQGMGQVLDARSDIYSLGVILYEMITGRPPYIAETPLAVVLKHINDPLPPPRSINPDAPEFVERIILKALTKNRDDRYATAGDLVHALQAYKSTIREPVYLARETIIENYIAPGELIKGSSAGPLSVEKTDRPDNGVVKRNRIFAMVGSLIGLTILIILFLLWKENSLETSIVPEINPGTNSGEAGFSPISQPDEKESVSTLTPVSITIVATQTPVFTPTATPPPPSSTPAPLTDSFIACTSSCEADGSNAASRFPGGTKKLYLRWSYENIPVGAHYVRYWTMNGLEWVRYDCTWSGPTRGVDEITLTEPGGLHSGTWEVTIMVDDQVILREEVYVDGNWSFWEPAGVFYSCYGK